MGAAMRLGSVHSLFFVALRPGLLLDVLLHGIIRLRGEVAAARRFGPVIC
jgi:hypothetical protein